MHMVGRTHYSDMQDVNVVDHVTIEQVELYSNRHLSMNPSRTRSSTKTYILKEKSYA